MPDNSHIQVTVTYFALLQEITGLSEEQISLPETSTVQDFRHWLKSSYPSAESLMPTLLVAVNGEYADDQTVLQSSNSLACFPPVSGG